MEFPTPIIFLKAVGIMGFIFMMLFAVIYWIIVFTIKLSPNLFLKIKYNILKKDISLEHEEIILEMIEKEKSPSEVKKELLLKGVPEKEVKEIFYLKKILSS